MLPNFTGKSNYLLIPIFIAPIILFWVYIFRHAVNMPYMDDMELIDSINLIKENPSKLFSILVRQQNDHRVAFSRLGMLLIYILTGAIDFKLAIMLGFFNLLLLGYSLFLVYRSENSLSLSFLPAILLSFSPLVYADHLWSITAFQYTLSVAFSILALNFLQPKNRNIWYVSLPLMAAATLTNLDGLSIIPVSILWLICQKRWRHVGLCVLFSCIYLAIYFTNFKLSPASRLEFSSDSIVVMGHSFLAIVGSLAKIPSDTHAMIFSTITGGIIILAFIIIKISPGIFNSSGRQKLRSAFELDFTDISLLKVLASMAMIAIGRCADGADAMMGIRFQVYSVSLVVLFYFFLLKTFGNRGKDILAFAGCFAALLIGGYSYIKYDPDVDTFSSGLKADSYNYAHNGLYLHQYLNLPDPDPRFYKNYSFPVFFSQDIIDLWKTNVRAIPPATELDVTEVKNTERYWTYITPVLEFRIKIATSDIPEKEIFLAIFSDANPDNFLLIATREDKGSLIKRPFVKTDNRKFAAHIPKKIPSGNYAAMLCWIENGKPRSVLLAEKISI